MASKLFVKLQTPVVELPVAASDVIDEKNSIVIGFRRYGQKELIAMFEEQQKLSEEAQAELATMASSTSILTSPKAKALEEKAIENLKKDIIYIKDASVGIYDEDTLELLETIEIPDSRIATPNSFWGTPQECLKVLVEHYLDSAPWKEPILDAHNKALFNKDFGKEKAKN